MKKVDHVFKTKCFSSKTRKWKKDPSSVSEEDITEAAPFFNIIEEDDVEDDINID